MLNVTMSYRSHVITLCIASVLLTSARTAEAGTLDLVWTNQPGSGFTTAESAVIDASMVLWESVLAVPIDRTLNLTITSGTLSGAVGIASEFTSDPLGNPIATDITIDSGTSFFVDPTPFDNSEYTPSGSPAHWFANGGGPAAGQWDLLSVVHHEIGHAVGFTDNYDRFASRLSGLTFFGETGFSVQTTDGAHLDDGFDLMGDPGFQSSERALTSPLNLQILNDTFDYNNKRIYSYNGPPALVPPSGTSGTSLVTIDVTEHVSVLDVDVALLIEHTFVGDLDISITSPSGTTVLLSSDNGGAGENYGTADLHTRFDDGSVAFDIIDFGAPFEGTYAPEGSLSDIGLANEDAFGIWTLEIVDDASGDSGALQAFSLIVTASLLDGDLNGDGFVGVDDLNIVLVNWNQNVTPGDLLSGDPTGEGFVGVDDLNVVLVNWNAGTPPPGDALALVPEPTASAVWVCGMMLLRRRGRRVAAAVTRRVKA